MIRSLKKYRLEFVREFYINYASMFKNITPSIKEKDMRKKHPVDIIKVWDYEVDISVMAISNVLFGNIF